MDVRFRLCLFLVILVIVANAIVIKEPEKRFHPAHWRPPRFDWPHGVCSFVGDRCAPGTPFPCGANFACPLPTNTCCCWDRILGLKPTLDFKRGENQLSSMPGDMSQVDGRVGRLALGFDKLMEDPAGLGCFKEFLKKEFRDENIVFWIACDNFRGITDFEEEMVRKKRILKVWEFHSKSG